MRVLPGERTSKELKQYLIENKATLLTQVDKRDKLKSGVGSQLERIIPSFLSPENCNCSKDALRWDKAGVEWCEREKAALVKKIVRRANKTYPHLPGKEMTISLLVTEAIRRARKKPPTYKPGSLFVGITTAPRKEETVTNTIVSCLSQDLPPMLFAEPGSLPHSVPTQTHNTVQGAWHNWLYMARYSLTYNCDHYLFLQDDVALHPDTHTFILNHLPTTGFLSLYAPRKYGKRNKPGIHRVHTKSLWGACALLFPRKTLERLVSHPKAQTWLGARARNNPKAMYEKRKNNPHLIANVDTAVGMLMNKIGEPMNFVFPSPVKHTARFSTLKHGGNLGQRNCDPCADPTHTLTEQVECL